jgi:uncharacterized membrane protein (UPF0127 family)
MSADVDRRIVMRHRRHRIVSAIALACIAVGAACRSDAGDEGADRYAHVMAFDTARIRLVGARDTQQVTVELAETSEQQTMGLMERRTLPADAGMLFVYPAMQPDTSAFWMYRTRLPLDIAFIDSSGVIRTIRTMAPCPTLIVQGCPTYPAGARYLAALEVNAGYFGRTQVRVGDRVLLQDTASRRRASRPPS